MGNGIAREPWASLRSPTAILDRPFWPEILRSPESWDATHRNRCPGMNQGRHYELVQIETIRTQKEW